MGRIGEWLGRNRENASVDRPEDLRDGAGEDPVPPLGRGGPDPAGSGDLREGAGRDPAPESHRDLHERIVEALKQVYDPEIPVNIYDLGLIYRLDVGDEGAVTIDMTLTTPGCPVAETFPGMVEYEVEKVEGVKSAEVEVVWDPPWTQERMTEAAKLELGLW